MVLQPNTIKAKLLNCTVLFREMHKNSLFLQINSHYLYDSMLLFQLL